MMRCYPALVVTLMAIALPAYAQDALVDAAVAAGSVGEQADGYLGIRTGGGADLSARVDQINIKRRALYTRLAASRGVTIADVAAATACQTLDSVAPGGWWRDPRGTWVARGAGAIAKPAYCG